LGCEDEIGTQLELEEDQVEAAALGSGRRTDVALHCVRDDVLSQSALGLSFPRTLQILARVPIYRDTHITTRATPSHFAGNFHAQT
jgi:hypothetical protein